MYCPNCGAPMQANEWVCGQCGWRDTVRETSVGDDPAMRLLLPVGRSFWAIAAGYCGLLSPLVVFAPFAVLFGVAAIIDIRKNPQKHGMGRAIFGIIAGGFVTLLLIVGIVAGILSN